MKRLKTISTTLSLGLLLSTQTQANYCAGIRGNRELAPIHWGAINAFGAFDSEKDMNIFVLSILNF